MAVKTQNPPPWKTLWRKIWYSNNTYDTLTPLYKASKLLGLAPYSFKEVDGRRKYVSCKYEVFYSVLFLLGYIAFFCYANDGNNKVKLVMSKKHSKVASFIDSFQWYATVFIMVGLVITNCFTQNTLMSALEEIVSIDSKIENFGLKIDHYKVKKHVAANVIWQITIYIVMERLNCSLFLTEMQITSAMCYTLCYIPLLISGFVKGQFVVLVSLLKHRFEVLNTKLLTLCRPNIIFNIKTNSTVRFVQGNAFQVRDTICTARKIHGQLCNIGSLINQAFSLQILSIIGYNFISFTAHAYFCIESYLRIYIEKDNIDFALGTTTMWAIVKLSVLFHLTYVCNQTKNEVFESAVIIHKIQYRHNVEISEEVIMFSKQILHWNFKFTANDLFEIDMSLFYLMFSSAATYLVILIQMDITVNQNLNLNFANNTFRLGG